MFIRHEIFFRRLQKAERIRVHQSVLVAVMLLGVVGQTSFGISPRDCCSERGRSLAFGPMTLQGMSPGSGLRLCTALDLGFDTGQVERCQRR